MADRNLELALHIKAIVDGAKSIEDLSDKLEAMGQEAKAAAAPADALGQDLKEVATAAQQADTAMDAVAQSTEKTGKAAKGTSDPMAQLRAQMQAIKDQRNPMDEFNRGLTETEQAMRPVPGALEQLKGMAGQLAAVFLTAKEALDLNDRFTALQRGFTAVTGSAEATEQSMDFVRGVADRLGVGVLELGMNFLKLSAAAKGTQLEGAATEQIFSSLTSAMITVGASTGDVENALNAVAQMMSKGVVSAEELRGQLGDVLPGAAQQAAAAMGVSTAEFNKMLESGEVLAKDFLPKFAAQLDQTFVSGKSQVESFTASWNRLLNLLSDLATGPVGTGFTKFISTATDGLGLLARGANFVADGVGAAGKALGGLAAGEATEATKDFGQALVDASVKLFGYRTEAEVATERKKQMAEELRNLIPEVDRFQNAISRKELKELPESLQTAIAEFKKTGDAAVAAKIAIEQFMQAPAQNLNLDGVLKLAANLRAVGNEAAGAGQQISASLGQQLATLTNEQLTALEQQARKAMAEASSGSETSRKAFAELGQVVEGVVLARLQRLGVDGPEALNGLSLGAKDAIADFTALAKTGDLTGEAIEKAFEGALAKLDSAEEIAAFRQKIVELGQSGTLTGEQVERALLLIRQRAQEVNDDPAFAALTKQLAGVREETERGVEAGAREYAVRKTQITAALDLAKAKGDEAAAAQLAADAAKLEVERAQERGGEIKNLITLTDRHVNLLYTQAQADGLYTTAERAVIEALQTKVETLRQEQAQIDAKLPLMEREAQQAAIMAGPIGELGRLYAANTKEHERAADAADSYYNAQIKEVDAAIRVAKAKGDEAQASELLEKKQGILIEQAYARARALATEVADAQNAVAVKQMEAAADGVVTQAEQEQIAVLENLVVVKQNAAASAAANAEAMNQEAEAMKEVAKAAKESKDNIDLANESFKQTGEDLDNVNAAFAKFRDISAVAFGIEGIVEYEAIIKDIQSAIDEANTQAQRLADEGMAAATGNAGALAAELQNSQSYLNEAADAAADNLVNALQEAQAAALELREELAGVATDYSQKILELVGDDYTSLLVDRGEALADLEEKYGLAGQTATQAYLDAKNAVIAYYDVKLAKAKEDAAADTTAKNTAQMQALARATAEAEAAATRLANTNLSTLITQSDTLSNNMKSLWEFL